MIVGREAQIRELGAFVRAGTGTLVIRGDAGSGKSALLREAVRFALLGGTRVLELADLPFPGDADDFELGAAVTARLRRADRPLLVVVDDVHRLDERAARALSFAARRVRGRAVAFLATAPAGHEAFAGPATVVRDLPPLDDQAVFALLARVAPSAPIAVRRRVAAEAQGNPLALVSFAGSLTGEQLRLERPLPPALAAPAGALDGAAARVAALSESARLLLLTAALEGTGDARVLSPGGLNPGLDLAEVERAGLAGFDPVGRRLRFAHPLVPSAVVAQASAESLRQAHRRLGRCFEAVPDVRLRHMAATLAGPDAETATRLEQAGHRALTRGDNAGAADFFLMAAERSPARSAWQRLISQARLVSADALRLVPHVELLMSTALGDGRDPDAALATALLGGYASMLAGADPGSAMTALAGAMRARGGRADTRFIADESLWALAHLTHVLGTPRQEQFAGAADRARPEISPSVDAQVRLFNDPARATPVQLRSLTAKIAELPGAGPSDAIRTGMASMFVDRLEDCRDALTRIVRDGRRHTPSFLAAHARTMLAFADFRRGDWDAAAGHADEEVMFSESGGHPLQPLGAYPVRVLVEGLRGDTEKAERTFAELAEQAASAGQTGAVERIDWARALLSLAAGDAEAAYQRLSAQHRPGEFPAGQPYALWSAFDLTEAAVRAGRPALARKHAAALRAHGIAALSSRMAFLTAAAAALASEDSEAGYEAALGLAKGGRWPLEEARLRLAFGRLSADRGSTAAARDQFVRALRLFGALGVSGWRKQTEAAIEKLAPPPEEDLVAVTLTDQERRIAELAAHGLSNREIAARLVVSPRTVGGHLYRVFPKLGVTSRVSLRAALHQYDAASGPAA
ncbi:LuxR C-terminal-related transcriptional regulator [Actinoplanes sp. CA-054009]